MVAENELAAQALKLADKRYCESTEIGRFGDIGMSPCCKHTTCFLGATLDVAKLLEIHWPALSVRKAEPVLTPGSVSFRCRYNCTMYYNPHDVAGDDASRVDCMTFVE